MKKCVILKRTVGIVGTLVGGLVFIQSFLVSALEDLSGLGVDDSGYGIIMAILLIAVGIVGICTCKKEIRWGLLGITLAYACSGWIGVEGSQNYYQDLGLYAFISFIAAAIYAVLFLREVFLPKATATIEKGNASTEKVNKSADLDSAAESLKKYKELLDCGAITEEEYSKKKDEILKG